MAIQEVYLGRPSRIGSFKDFYRLVLGAIVNPLQVGKNFNVVLNPRIDHLSFWCTHEA